MGLISRILMVFKVKANSALDRVEDPAPARRLCLLAAAGAVAQDQAGPDRRRVIKGPA